MRTPGMEIDPANAEQARAWDGDDGRFWAEHAPRFDASMARYHHPFLDAARIGDGTRVLDIGCGTGQTTRDAARRAPGGWALGVDLSSPMLELARRLAAEEGVDNARFLQADAQVHAFAPGGADVAVSRAGSMFFGDPVAAFANIAAALRPGGRLVLLTWQPVDRNEWLPAFAGALAAGRPLPVPPSGVPGPFALGDPERVRSLLGAAGFADVRCEDRREPLCFGATPDEAHAFVLGLLGWMLRGLDDAGAARATTALRDAMEAHDTADGVLFGSAAWLVTAVRP
jgi:SAM-dependent methyltransferase